MRQHARFKAQHPDCVLFFRMGDFYEMFDEDALLAHKALGITLTQRTEGVPMAGVPYHAVESYLRRMIRAGYRVAVCDQVQDPRDARGIVERAVTRVLTPGTLVDEALLDESRPNQVVAVDLAASHLAAVELSTGSFWLRQVPADRLPDEVSRIGPSEVLYAEAPGPGVPAAIQAIRDASGCALTPRPAWTFRPHEARECVLEHFGVRTTAGWGLEDDDPGLAAAGAALQYLRETQAPDGDAARRLGHLRPPRRDPVDRFVGIDAATLANLEIERTLRRGTAEGSLLSVFSRCATAMGRRRLREWLCFPLRDRAGIEARHAAVGALVADPSLADGLGAELGGVQDVARIQGRISVRRATPRDLVALGRSAGRAAPLLALLDGHPALAAHHDRLAAAAPAVAETADAIGSRCIDDPPGHLREGGLFRDGVDAELDDARGLQRDATGWLARYQKALIDDTGIGSLKVGYNKVFGYYIEVTHAQAAKVPPQFSRKQTLKNAERYITPDLKTFEDKVTTAEARAVEREKTLFEELCAAAAARGAAITEYAEVVAELDVLRCFAEVARRHGYVRPQLADEPVLAMVQGRHPVLDVSLGRRYVPNDCRLGPGCGAGHDATLALITGPNMAGKSTYIRQVALGVLLAHAGSFVPAESAVIGLTDRIFSRIGASDELHAGRSTFMVEMIETANILHHATDRSVVILDEIGRGTGTLDGLSLAWAIAETLAARGCRTLFATHYHELTRLGDDGGAVTNLHVAVREWGDEVIFVYRIMPGGTDRSYGLHVARIAGLPRAVIDRAAAVLETLAVHTDSAPRPAAGPPAPPAQLSLFTEYLQHPVIDRLRALDLESMSPLEAFDALRRLRGEV